MEQFFFFCFFFFGGGGGGAWNSFVVFPREKNMLYHWNCLKLQTFSGFVDMHTFVL